MPERAECGDVVIQNGALAALAARGEQLQEVPPAVGAALSLVETWGRGQTKWAGQDPRVAVGRREGEGVGQGKGVRWVEAGAGVGTQGWKGKTR